MLHVLSLAPKKASKALGYSILAREAFHVCGSPSVELTSFYPPFPPKASRSLSSSTNIRYENLASSKADCATNAISNQSTQTRSHVRHSEGHIARRCCHTHKSIGSLLEHIRLIGWYLGLAICHQCWVHACRPNLIAGLDTGILDV